MSLLTYAQAEAFAHLLTHRTDRAALAELRRAAANPEHDFRDIRILGPQLADAPLVFDAQRLIAGLFALYAPRFWQADDKLRFPRFPENSRRSFGASLRMLRNQLSAGQDSLDLRFGALLNTQGEDLTVPLRNLLTRLSTANHPVPVDFAQLLLDVVYWNSEGRSVRRNWARDYWRAAVSELEEEATTADQPAA
mgnify:CR=1 FL=1